MKTPILVSLCAASVMVLAVCKVFAAGDVEKGRKIAKKCTICHTLNEGGKNRLGPNLFDILGKPAGAVEGYKYSKALLASGIVWDDDTFSDFVLNPKKVIKRTKMSFKGIKKVTHRVDLLAYFKTLRSDTGDQQSVGNVEEGKRVAAKHCVICHSFEKGGKVVYGPNLFGIVGAPGGAIAGYEYSAALKNAGLTWTDANLIGFVANPEKFLKGTKARFPGLKSAKQRADLLAYLKTLK